jgi:4-azaleucine resistance transporter AzlC
MSAPASASARATFFSGVRDIAPILIGIFPFGIIAGVAAVEAGLPAVQAIAASPMIFAGASQLATMDLLGRGSPALVIVMTALVINSRFAMYSAGLSPSFRMLGRARKSLAAYLLTDQAFAASAIRFAAVDENLDRRFLYYLGAATPPWLVWQASTVTGVVVGSGVSPNLSLDFAIPLMFMALLFPAITDRTTALTAGVAAVAAVSLRGLPLNLGLLVAAAVAITVGVVTESRLER